MLRPLIAAVAVTVSLIGAPAAQAAPAFCDPHGTDHVYIHACAGGGGGGRTVWRPLAEKVISKKTGELKTAYRCHQSCGGGRHSVTTTDPW